FLRFGWLALFGGLARVIARQNGTFVPNGVACRRRWMGPESEFRQPGRHLDRAVTAVFFNRCRYRAAVAFGDEHDRASWHHPTVVKDLAGNGPGGGAAAQREQEQSHHQHPPTDAPENIAMASHNPSLFANDRKVHNQSTPSGGPAHGR